MNEGINTTNSESNLEKERNNAILWIKFYRENTAKKGNNDNEFDRFKKILAKVENANTLDEISECVEEARLIPDNKNRD